LVAGEERQFGIDRKGFGGLLQPGIGIGEPDDFGGTPPVVTKDPDLGGCSEESIVQNDVDFG
jgi:hypothetical protein